MSGRAKNRTLYFEIAEIAYFLLNVLGGIGYLGKGLYHLQILVSLHETGCEVDFCVRWTSGCTLRAWLG